MSDDFGAGIALDEQFDFTVDSTGDIDSTSGVEELQKDLAFQMVVNLDQYLGQPETPNLEAKVSRTVKNVALGDERIQSVSDDSISVIFEPLSDTITVEMSARTVDEQVNLIFEI